jgi:hypothetical protein
VFKRAQFLEVFANLQPGGGNVIGRLAQGEPSPATLCESS